MKKKSRRHRRPESFKEIIWLSFSEADERFLDLFRVGYALGISTFAGLTIYTVLNGAPFDPVDFGAGFGGLLFGGAMGVGWRGKLEDGTTSPQDDIEEVEETPNE